MYEGRAQYITRYTGVDIDDMDVGIVGRKKRSAFEGDRVLQARERPAGHEGVVCVQGKVQPENRGLEIGRRLNGRWPAIQRTCYSARLVL